MLSDFGMIVLQLKGRRQFRRLTQKQLGQMVGVSPRTIFALENGDDSVSIKTFFGVANALDFRVAASIDESHQAKVRAAFGLSKLKTHDVVAYD